MWSLQSNLIVYSLLVKLSVEINANTWQSCIDLCNDGFEFVPFDDGDHLLNLTTDLLTSCARICALTTHCRTFNYNSHSQQCQLFQGDIDTVGSIISSNSSHATCGSVVLNNENFVDYGRHVHIVKIVSILHV